MPKSRFSSLAVGCLLAAAALVASTASGAAAAVAGGKGDAVRAPSRRKPRHRKHRHKPRPKKKLPVLNVVPQAAEGAATQTIGPQGGTLRVTTPNGTAVTLAVPAGALGGDTQVTMTPLAAVKKLPLKKGLVAAVQIGPEGLTLARPATLAFQPRKRVPKKLATPFAASGTGKSFHLYPGKKGRLPLFHFSVYGEGRATPKQRAAEARRRQSDAQSQAERDLARASSDEALAKAFLPWMERVAAEVQAAASDDSHFVDALDHALSLAEALRLYGWSSDVFPDIGDQIPKRISSPLRGRLEQLAKKIAFFFPDKILNNALDKARQRCSADHDPSQGQRILAIEELRRLVGLTDEVDLAPVRMCFTVEFDLDSTVHVAWVSPFDAHVRAQVPLPWSPDGGWTGSGSLDYVSVNIASICGLTDSGSGTLPFVEVKATPAKLDSELRVVEPLKIDSVTMRLSPTDATEIETGICGDTHERFEDHYFTGAWYAAHLSEWQPGWTYDIGNFSAGSGDILATKTYDRSYVFDAQAGIGATESTTLEVRHTPTS